MTRTYGLVARFDSAEALTAALRRLRHEGYEQLEAFAPRPLEEAHALLPHRRSPVPAVMLVGGAAGAASALFLQAWASTDYPLNVASRPLFSWPAFVPVAFELTVLAAAFAGLLAFLVMSGLPRLDHPAFAHNAFPRASQDGFFVCVPTTDRRFHPQATRELLRTVGATEIEEVSS